MLPGSLPWLGSVKPKAPTISPRAEMNDQIYIVKKCKTIKLNYLIKLINVNSRLTGLGIFPSLSTLDEILRPTLLIKILCKFIWISPNSNVSSGLPVVSFQDYYKTHLYWPVDTKKEIY